MSRRRFMDERDWDILLMLYQTQNITRAAENLFITQAALSIRIKSIEKYFGTKLVERHSHGIFFTPIGRHAVEFAREHKNALENLKKKMVIMQDQNVEELRIAMAPILVRFLTTRIVGGFSHLYPYIDFRVRSMTNDKIIKALQNNSVHIGITRSKTRLHGFVTEKFADEGIFIVTSAPVEIKDLEEMTYIDYRQDPYFCSEFKTWWEANFSHPPRRTLYITDFDACKELVRMGKGFGFFPQLLIRSDPDLFAKPVAGPDGQPLQRSTYILCREGMQQNFSVNLFLQFVKEMSKSWK